MDSALDQFYSFFNLSGMDRLDGMPPSIISSMTSDEKSIAFDYIKNRIDANGGSDELVYAMLEINKTEGLEHLKQLLIADRLSPDAEISVASALHQDTRDPALTKYFIRNYHNDSYTTRLSAVRQTPTNHPSKDLLDALIQLVYDEDDSFGIKSEAISRIIELHGIEPSISPKSTDAYYSNALSSENVNDINNSLADLANRFPISYAPGKY
jgi:hypothetical protein